MTKTFRDLGVDGALCDALAAEGITHPFPIQELTLPLALEGNDLIGQARTGTGKTLAFGLPLLQRLDADRAQTQALIVVPTRELCLQVYEDLKIGAARGLTSIAVYGGVGFEEQIEALQSGVHVVVGTPGRLLDHLNRRNLDLSNVTQLVLDEADEMLDMGFLPDVERLIQACGGADRHTMLFSATMPTAIVKLARRYMDHPTFTRADSEQHETAPNVAQHFFQVHRMDKPRVLARILQSPNRGGVYVFVRTKHMADRLVNELDDLGVGAIPIHGDLRQTSREKNLERFRSGKATVLVATEVAARGLDVGGVTHVVNYDCPDDEKMYLHRIGRTARAGEAGVAITFAEFNEVDKLNVIRKRVGATETPVEQVFSTSDLLAEIFELPEERPWDRESGSGSRPSSRAGSGRSGSQRSGSGRSGSGRHDSGDRDDRRGGRDGADRRRDGGRSGDRSRKAEASDRDGAAKGDRGDAAKSEREGAPKSERSRSARSEDSKRGERAADERAEAPSSGDERGSNARPRARRGTSDGRPKSERRTEGSGDAHDASRTRARPSRPRRDDADREPRSGQQARSGDGARTRDRGGDGEGASDRERTRKRTRSRSTHGEGAGERRSATKDARDDRSTERTRERSDGDEPQQRKRARGSRTRSANGGSESGERSGTERRGGEGRGGSSRRSSARSGRTPGRDRGDSGGRKRSGSSDQQRSNGVPVQQRGRAARGEGQPQPSRRVRVEHLP